MKRIEIGSGVVVHAYNPTYLGGRRRRIDVWGQSGKKMKTLFENQANSKGMGV
jgi:hypothetical protein